MDCGMETVELLKKEVDKLQKIHVAQILTYMKLTGLSVGLLINFNEVMLKNGIKRFVL